MSALESPDVVISYVPFCSCLLVLSSGLRSFYSPWRAVAAYSQTFEEKKQKNRWIL
jgi:hypothetical protein